MKKPTVSKSRNRFRPIARPRIYTEDEIALSNVKVNIHIRLDADVVHYFKEKAAREGGKYQSLINQHLRETLWPKHDLEYRIQQIEERLGLHQ
jgi:uncharacterized protein (DUF4415 family)